jgi:beta-glucosidase
LNLVPCEPASPSLADLDATRAADGQANRWYLDPLYGRGYPADVIRDRVADGALAEPRLPCVQDGDLAAIAAATDFLGVNYYMRAIARSSLLPEQHNEPRRVHPRAERTDMGWEVFPDGLERILGSVNERYAPARIYVTENGAAYADEPPAGARAVHDAARQSYLERHLRALHRARRSGVPVSGYFLWSLLDNFEWAEGFSKRFGIVWVDYQSQQRLPKDSAHWYRRVIAEGGLPDTTSSGSEVTRVP